MIDYYLILHVKIAKKEGTLTDDMVKQNYLYLKKQCEKYYKGNILEEQLLMLEDAYNALKSENARKHYDEILHRIQKYMYGEKSKKSDKSKNKNFKENLKFVNEDTNFEGKAKKFNKMINDFNKTILPEEHIEMLRRRTENWREEKRKLREGLEEREDE